jgi:hypothetical protein
MSADIVVAATLAVSGLSAVYAFSMSLRKDVLPAVLSTYRKSAPLIVSLASDGFAVLLVLGCFFVVEHVTAKVVGSGTFPGFAKVLDDIMKGLLALTLSVKVISHSFHLILERFISKPKTKID